MSEKLLIVEDEFIVANNLRLILQQAGYTVCGIAASVEEARKILKAHTIDIALLDIHLKGALSGIDLALELKDDHIPFVYLSANSNQSILEAAKATEPYGFLVKPYREKDILVTLEIARYRYKHSIESKIKHEASLQSALHTIAATKAEWCEQLLKTAVALQPYIPFDLIDLSVPGNILSDERSLLRIGFNEYQPIGIAQLAVIANVKVQEIEKAITTSPPAKMAALYNSKDFEQLYAGNALQKVYATNFQLQSAVSFPLLLADQSTIVYSFYSRKADAFHSDHLALLIRLQQPLSAIASFLSVHNNAAGIRSNDHVQKVTGHNIFKDIIGSSDALLAALDMVTQVAPLDTSVLLLGESGTGKERIAESIHELSARKNGPFVKINCATLPNALIESELFGHEKGAFTGATDRKTGRFEQATGGTIFLDEIGELPIDQQAKLLRVLQEKEVERIGGKQPIKVDVRIIAATNRLLEKEVSEGRFRLDLYYRLNVFPITLPALKERKEDIALLAQHFAIKFSDKFKKAFNGISTQMLIELEDYHWPGNIRELENIMEQSVILNDGEKPITLKRPLLHATAHTTTSTATINSLDDIKAQQLQHEKAYITSILKKTKGKIRGNDGAAALLDQKPTTLESRMARLGIKKEDFY